MSKRLAEDDEGSTIRAKRVRSTKKDGHVADCNDPECQGCDVGEVEFSFVRKDENGDDQAFQPTADDLLSMAITEANAEQDSDTVRRLFDMALEQFEKKEPENRTGYATCLIELGRAINVEESLREGLDILRGITKQGDASALTTEHWLQVARAALGLLLIIRKGFNTTFEEFLEEQEDEVLSEQQLTKYSLKREEIGLYKEALSAVDKALVSMKDLPTKEARSVLHDMQSYVQLLDHPLHYEHVATLTKTLEKDIQQFSYKTDPDLLTLSASSLIHKQSLLVEDPEKQKDILNQSEKLLLDACKLYRDEYSTEYPRGWELLAMTQLNQSNLLDDEDEVIKKYEEAVESFKTAHKLNPDNADLENMINMLLGEGEEEE